MKVSITFLLAFLAVILYDTHGTLSENDGNKDEVGLIEENGNEGETHISTENVIDGKVDGVEVVKEPAKENEEERGSSIDKDKKKTKKWKRKKAKRRQKKAENEGKEKDENEEQLDKSAGNENKGKTKAAENDGGVEEDREKEKKNSSEKGKKETGNIEKKKTKGGQQKTGKKKAAENDGGVEEHREKEKKNSSEKGKKETGNIEKKKTKEGQQKTENEVKKEATENGEQEEKEKKNSSEKGKKETGHIEKKKTKEGQKKTENEVKKEATENGEQEEKEKKNSSEKGKKETGHIEKKKTKGGQKETENKVKKEATENGEQEDREKKNSSQKGKKETGHIEKKKTKEGRKKTENEVKKEATENGEQEEKEKKNSSEKGKKETGHIEKKKTKGGQKETENKAKKEATENGEQEEKEKKNSSEKGKNETGHIEKKKTKGGQTKTVCQDPLEFVTLSANMQLPTLKADAVYRIDHKLMFECIDGHVVSGSNYAICLGNGTWLTVDEGGCSPVCRDPSEYVTLTANMKLSTLKADAVYRTDHKLIFECIDDHVASGWNYAICLGNGTWLTVDDGGCFPVCQNPSQFVNLAANTELPTLLADAVYRPDHKLMFECLDGQVASGCNYAICLGNGTWLTVDEGGCSPVCQDPSKFVTLSANMQLPALEANAVYRTDHKLMFECVDDHVASGSNYAICLQNGIWQTVDKGGCSPVCQDPSESVTLSANMQLPTLEADAVYRTDYKLMFECLDNHVASGSNYAICLGDGTWLTVDEGGCYPDCGVENLPIITNGEFVPMSNGAYKDVAELVCLDGHLVVDGPGHVVCQADGTWTSTTTACVPITVNMALGKSTWQSSTYSGYGAVGSSSNAVDGNRNPNWNGHSMTHTTYENRPWWMVDLGHVYTIKYVDAYNRQDCCEDGMSNVYVMVSETLANFEENDLAGNENQCGFVLELGVNHRFNCPASVRGRYVKVVVDKNSFVTLSELEVYVDL